MKRFLAALLTLFALSPTLVQAQELRREGSKFIFRELYMRNTSASAVARDPNWAKGSQGSVTGFADSVVFRRAVGTLTVYDTTQAIAVANLGWPPQVAEKAGTTVLTDTTNVLPWIALRVRQDTLSYGYTSVSAMDSIHAAAQFSVDGANWISVAGTITKNPATAFFTSGEDGVAPLGMSGSEVVLGGDVVTITLDCIPVLYNIQPNGPLIMNRNLCGAPGWIRFVIAMDGTGQFKTELGSWAD